MRWIRENRLISNTRLLTRQWVLEFSVVSPLANSFHTYYFIWSFGRCPFSSNEWSLLMGKIPAHYCQPWPVVAYFILPSDVECPNPLSFLSSFICIQSLWSFGYSLQVREYRWRLMGTWALSPFHWSSMLLPFPLQILLPVSTVILLLWRETHRLRETMVFSKPHSQ